jgi:hypothetical protein
MTIDERSSLEGKRMVKLFGNKVLVYFHEVDHVKIGSILMPENMATRTIKARIELVGDGVIDPDYKVGAFVTFQPMVGVPFYGWHLVVPTSAIKAVLRR